jgi:hypothetical protein
MRRPASQLAGVPPLIHLPAGSAAAGGSSRRPAGRCEFVCTRFWFRRFVPVCSSRVGYPHLGSSAPLNALSSGPVPSSLPVATLGWGLAIGEHRWIELGPPRFAAATFRSLAARSRTSGDHSAAAATHRTVKYRR